MKQYSRKSSNTHSESMAVLKNRVKSQIEDSIMDSVEFAKTWEPYIRDIALTKEANGKKYYRSQEYASIGVLDRNDLIQEAYACFFHVYSNVDWKRIEKSNNPEAELWSYLKKGTINKLQQELYKVKDGIRVTEYAIRKAKEEDNITNMNVITSLFNRLDILFFKNQEDTALTKYQTDLLGYFLESHMDDYLDLNFKGNRNYKGIERELVMQFYGIDCERRSRKDLSEQYKISPSTIGVVVKRAITKLKSDESKEIIRDFCKEYSIETQADVG